MTGTCEPRRRFVGQAQSEQGQGPVSIGRGKTRPTRSLRRDDRGQRRIGPEIGRPFTHRTAAIACLWEWPSALIIGDRRHLHWFGDATSQAADRADQVQVGAESLPRARILIGEVIEGHQFRQPVILHIIEDHRDFGGRGGLYGPGRALGNADGIVARRESLLAPQRR